MNIKTLTAAALVLALAGPASAATLKLTATAKFAWQSSDFSIVFEDLDGDMRLSADEVLSFSGFTSFQLDQTYSELLRISPVPVETDVPQTFTSRGIPLNTWLFGEGTDFRATAQPSAFTYEVSPLSVVPLPATALMLLAGLGGLYGIRRHT